MRGMKILITGASGLLGHALGERLGRDHDVSLWGYTQARGPYTSVDLRNGSAVASSMRVCAPDVVIHAAAYRDPDYCQYNMDDAWALNVEGTRHVVTSAGNWDARVVFISTDYVFDGSSPPYTEASAVNPLNVYGQTKAEAETVVREAGGDHLILRIPILYGPGATPGSDLIEKLGTAVQVREPKEIDDVAQRAPTLTTDVAEVAAMLIGRGAGGTFHASSGDVMTQYRMAMVVAKVLGLPADHIHPGPAVPRAAQRPMAATLDTTKLRTFGFDRFTRFEEGVRKVLPR
jgi:S-adenosylmethionine synthetase